MKSSQRLADALRYLAAGVSLTPEQRAELEASGWGDASPRQAREELEEQRKQDLLQAGAKLRKKGWYQDGVFLGESTQRAIETLFG